MIRTRGSATKYYGKKAPVAHRAQDQKLLGGRHKCIFKFKTGGEAQEERKHLSEVLHKVRCLKTHNTGFK